MVYGKKTVSIGFAFISTPDVSVNEYSVTTPLVTVTVGFPGESLKVCSPSTKLSGLYTFTGSILWLTVVTVPVIWSVVFQYE